MGPLDTVKQALQAFATQDRASMERLIGAPYSFTSPFDNGLSRQGYFARCWPNSAGFTAMNFIRGAETGEWAFITYEGTANGKRFRNMEAHRVVDGRIVVTEVYFGWNLPQEAKPGGWSE